MTDDSDNPAACGEGLSFPFFQRRRHCQNYSPHMPAAGSWKVLYRSLVLCRALIADQRTAWADLP